ncbi:unnamed protein product, partial [marine sediment metagenome]
ASRMPSRLNETAQNDKDSRPDCTAPSFNRNN